MDKDGKGTLSRKEFKHLVQLAVKSDKRLAMVWTCTLKHCGWTVLFECGTCMSHRRGTLWCVQQLKWKKKQPNCYPSKKEKNNTWDEQPEKKKWQSLCFRLKWKWWRRPHVKKHKPNRGKKIPVNNNQCTLDNWQQKYKNIEIIWIPLYTQVYR